MYGDQICEANQYTMYIYYAILCGFSGLSLEKNKEKPSSKEAIEKESCGLKVEDFFLKL